METNSFKEWLKDEVEHLDASCIMNLFVEFGEGLSLFPLDEENANEPFRTPWDAVWALRGEDLNKDYVYIDSLERAYTKDADELYELLEDNGIIDKMLRSAYKLRRLVGIDIDSYDFSGRISFLHEQDASYFSGRANEWFSSGGDPDDLSLFISEVYSDDFDDLGLISHFEEALEDHLSESED